MAIKRPDSLDIVKELPVLRATEEASAVTGDFASFAAGEGYVNTSLSAALR